ncbi:hypothetical protein [Chelativorans xinjiangense]|uniref:hypothetical protein n=1 Tax=Chelativorans xinjiangense TaxID=2681485 RepID=UPI001358C211|nr:hypothetical protein [Chelativorans xinjiangense]
MFFFYGVRKGGASMDVLVLVCALAVAAPDCQRSTAIHGFYAPDPKPDLAGCLREGLLYAARSGLVMADTYPKVFCIPQRSAEARASKIDKRE